MKKEICWVVTGCDGMDEISISDNTIILKINQNGKIVKEIFNPEDYGIKKRDKKLIEGKDPSYNAEKLINLLKGNIEDEKMEAYLDIVAINAGAALIIAGKADNFNEAILSVKDHIESGESYEFLKGIR